MHSKSGARDDDSDEVVSAVLTASRALVAVSARSLAEVEDRLTISQFRTLVVLDVELPTNLHRLAARLGVASSTALRSVDRLVAAGMVVREENSENRREVLISLTADGQHVVEAVTDRRRSEIARILRGMPPSARTELVNAFRAFARAAEEPTSTTLTPTSLGW